MYTHLIGSNPPDDPCKRAANLFDEARAVRREQQVLQARLLLLAAQLALPQRWTFLMIFPVSTDKLESRFYSS